MEPYSTTGNTQGVEDEAMGKPAPYNWLLVLLIFIGYIILVFFS